MSLAEAYHVHLGFWTNWSEGKFEGATLTLSRRNGNLLVAFIAIFVGAAGKSFWRVACFLLHRMLSSPRPQDGIYHQIQAILRNSDTAQDAAWSLGHVVWAWRVPARLRKPFPRLIGILGLALFVSISFGVAGVFSSQITSDTANEVLLKGDNCGPLFGEMVDNEAYSVIFEPFQNKRVTAYSNYALQCYSREVSGGMEDCHPFIKAKLKWTTDRNASCPFSKEMCKLETGNLVVDTGYLDSHEDLGINAAPENRFQMRLIHECAPIVTEDFSNVSTVTLPDNSTQDFQRFYYGAINEKVNYTHEISLISETLANSTKSVYSRTRADYGISVVKAYGGPLALSKQYSMFDPIDQLKRADADTMLFFLTGQGITYTNEVDDAWFSAHRKGPVFGNVYSNQSRHSYLRDEKMTVLGCAMKYQFCNPNLPEGSRCEPLHGMIDESFPVLDLWKTEEQKTAFTWMTDIIDLGFFSISGIVDHLGATAITARHGMSNNIQGPLPSNQWQKEVEHWVGTSLASIQGSFVEAANGPSKQNEIFRKAPNETAENAICQNQKIMTTKYSSFSVLGVGLILAIGGMFMVLDVALEPIVDYLQSRCKEPNHASTYARLEWGANATLQLQRLAHEHIGVGTWKSHGWDHPVTLPGEKLAMIDTTNESHATLIAPDKWEQMPSSRGSDTVTWDTQEEDERKPRRFDTFDSIESPKMKRMRTFESLKRGIRRVDTKTTLVNETPVGSPVTPFPKKEGGDHTMASPRRRERRDEGGDDITPVPAPQR